MARLYRDFLRGTLTVATTATSTTLTSAEFATLPTITAATDIMVLVLDPMGLAGAPEIVYVTAHAAAATTVTVTRAQETTTGRIHAIGAMWAHSPLSSDLTSVPATSPQKVTLPANAMSPRLAYGTAPVLTAAGTTGWWTGWGMDAATASMVGGQVLLPDGWSTAAIDVVWANDTVITGDFVMRSLLRNTAPGAVLAATSGTLTTVTSPAVANTLVTTRLSASFSVAGNGSLLSMGVERSGADVADTSTGKMIVLALVATRLT